MFNQNISNKHNGADGLSNSMMQQMMAAAGTSTTGRDSHNQHQDSSATGPAAVASGQQPVNQQLLQDNLLLQQQLQQQLQAASAGYPFQVQANLTGNTDMQSLNQEAAGGAPMMAGLQQGNMNNMASLQGNLNINSLANLGRMGSSFNSSQGNLANAAAAAHQFQPNSAGFPGNAAGFANATFNMGMNGGSANDLSVVTPSVAATQSASSMNSNLSSMSSAAMFQSRLQQQQAAAAPSSSLSSGIPNATFSQQQQAQQNGVPNNNFRDAGAGTLWSERAAGLLGNMLYNAQAPDGGAQPQKQEKRIKRKAPKDKPKRPLSAYNIFFKEERARLLAERLEESAHGKDKRTASGKIKFESLAKIIGNKWQTLEGEQVEYYKSKATDDMKRYKDEMEVYNNKKKGIAIGAESDALEDIKEAALEEHAGKKQKNGP